VSLLLSGLLLLSCRQTYDLDAEALRDPESCRDCHPTHYEQWRGSMHAYAAEDPVFLAMNARGQRETDGELGDFCVQCHAPVALSLGLTTDGTDLDAVPEHLRGVTCAWCHLVDEVVADHNAGLVLAEDGVMRGGISDPQRTDAHASAWSPLHDRDSTDSSALCGSCHDVVLPDGFHLERSYAEWRGSLFDADDATRQSCGHCHTRAATGTAARDGPSRRIHDHGMVGVDVALTDFPGAAEQEAAIQEELDYTLLATLCVLPIVAGSEVVLNLETTTGHRWPSGAAHDRRAWAEVTAWSGDAVLLQTGQVEADVALTDTPDPDRWELFDLAYSADGQPEHMFWNITATEERTLPVVTEETWIDHSVSVRWPLPGQTPDRVTAAVHIRPIGLDLLADLAQSGDLDLSALSRLPPTFTLGETVLEWTGTVGSCVP
jgi:nitrate/TMAO reductase-like tetraheme cytochrome c subunit